LHTLNSQEVKKALPLQKWFFALVKQRLLITLILFVLFYTTAFPQAYRHDNNGNLSYDANKEIASIHYNYLNLVDTLVYTDGRKIIYTYTATGQKLREQAILPDGTIKQKRDYIGSALYRNDSLREIQHNDGRIVPVLPGDVSTPWEYQYHLIDHLGDVRATITSNNYPVQYMATMESEQAEQEENLFNGLSRHRVIHAAANHTTSSNEVVRLTSATENVSLNLAVNSGDIVHLKVFAYYEGIAIDEESGGSRNVMNALLPVVESVLSVGVSSFLEGSATARSNGALNGMPGAVSADSENPLVAHLNYELFDENYQLVDAGFAAVTEKASFTKELLKLDSIKIRKSGYLRAYLSNTSPGNRAIYFDDFQVEHILSPVVQADSYDPFGMTLPEQHDERFGGVINEHLFNRKELQSDFDLNWYDYGARMYDPALGKWHAIDPLAEKYVEWSPYNYVMNNPVKFIDPDGREVKLGTENTYSGSVPDNVKKDQSGLSQIWRTAINTPVGRDIHHNAEENDLVIHVLLADPEYFQNERDKNALGYTGSPDNLADVDVIHESGKNIIKVKNPKGPYKNFDGMVLEVG
jgi:RHS repeat-associated protein